VPEALTILSQEEAYKLIDMDSVIKQAVERVEQSGIIFLDEIDKIAGEKPPWSGCLAGGGPKRHPADCRRDNGDDEIWDGQDRSYFVYCCGSFSCFQTLGPHS